RYIGQGFEVVVPLPSGPWTEATREPIRDAFEDAYRTTFGRLPPDVVIEIVNARVSMRAPRGDGTLELGAPREADAAALKGTRPAWFPEARAHIDTPVYDRYRLAAGVRVDGPAIVE